MTTPPVPYRPIRGAALALPAFFLVCVALGVFFTVLSLRGDGPPIWFLLLWLAALTWNAYWWLLRTCTEIAVDGATLRWRTPVRRGEAPVADVLVVRPSRAGRQMALVELRDRRPLLIPVRVGYGGFERDLQAAAPGVEVRTG